MPLHNSLFAERLKMVTRTQTVNLGNSGR